MHFKKLGNTDFRLSTIGLGTWAIGGSGYDYGWGTQDDKDSIDTIRKAVDVGINWIDTAPIYGLGHSEEIVGQAIKGIRDKVVVSTKCGFCWDDNKRIYNCLKKQSIRREVEDSLRRLDIEVIDLYQIHKPLPDEDIEEAWMELNRFVEEGIVRCVGVSSFNLQQLKRVQQIHPVSFIQNVYSIIQNETEEEGILDYCADNNIGVVCYSPMGSGLLTGKFTKEKVAALPPDDWRLKDAYFFQEPDLSANLELVEMLRPIAERNNKTLAQLAIAWVIRKPEVTSAIVGARKPHQIEQTAPGGDWMLSEQDKADLDAVVTAHHAKLKKLKEKDAG